MKCIAANRKPSAVAKVLLGFVLLALLLIIVPMGHSHIRPVSPLSRVDSDNVKQNFNNPDPCGGAPKSASGSLEIQAGKVMTFSINETIRHPGRFKVQWSPDGKTGFTEAENLLALKENTPPKGGIHNIDVSVPENKVCDECVLRVIQEMDDQPGNVYTHCFDVKITSATASTPIDGGSGGDGGNLGAGQNDSDGNEQNLSSTSREALPQGQRPGFGGCGVKNQASADQHLPVLAMVLMGLPMGFAALIRISS